MCDHRGPLIPSFRHPEALAPLGASHRKSAIADLRTRDPTSGKPEVGGRRPRPFILRGPRKSAATSESDSKENAHKIRVLMDAEVCCSDASKASEAPSVRSVRLVGG